MKLLNALLALVAALLLIVFGGGQFLAADYRVERSTRVQAPPAKVYALIDSSKGWASWGVWYRRDPQMKVSESGSAQGVGAVWTWTSESQGNGRMKLTGAKPERKIAYELAIDDFDPSQGEIELTPEAGGTHVRWTMHGRMSNTIGRWFALFMDRLVGPDFETGLANLKQLAEKQ